MIAKYFLFFIIYSFIGWAWECLISLVRDHKIVNRGFLNGPYCPIYGCGAILFLSLLHFTDNLAALFIVGGLLACVLEYITSFAMEKLFHARWWDYRNYPLNINGRVCLYGFLIFGAGAVLISMAHPHIDAFVNNIKNANTIAIIIAVIFTLDVITPNQGFAHFNKILRDYQATLKKGRVVNFIERKGRRFVEGLSERRRISVIGFIIGFYSPFI